MKNFFSLVGMVCLSLNLVVVSCGLSNQKLGTSGNGAKGSKSKASAVCKTANVSAKPAVITDTDLDNAYKSTIWALATKGGRCSGCHGSGQSPQFAASDIRSSRLSIADDLLGSPSTLELYAGNAHCGSSCSISVEMKAAIANFIKASNSGGSDSDTGSNNEQENCSIPQFSPSPSASPLPSVTPNPSLSPNPVPSLTPSPSATPSPTPVASAATGKTAYAKCTVCHSVGNFDTTRRIGTPDLLNKGNLISTKFPTANQPGVGNHTGVALSQAEIDGLKVFLANPQ